MANLTLLSLILSNLTLIGLILNFTGSAMLVCNTLANFGKPKSHVLIMYPDDDRKREIIRYDHTKKGLKEVKILKEEIKLAVSLVLLCSGFFLQILGFF